MEVYAARPGLQVVVADIGVTPQGGINWEAPVVKTYKAEFLPYFFILDGEGRILHRADAALAYLDQGATPAGGRR